MSNTDADVTDTDSAVPDTDTAQSDTDSNAPDTDSDMSDSETTVPDTDSETPDTNSDSADSDSAVPLPLYLDVRTPEEYAEGHCTTALNIPLDELKSRLDELGDRDRWIIVCCRSGSRAAEALMILEAAGFTDVENGGGFASLSCEKS